MQGRNLASETGREVADARQGGRRLALGKTTSRHPSSTVVVLTHRSLNLVGRKGGRAGEGLR